MNEAINYENPIPTRATQSRIFQFAEQLREQSNIKSGFDLPALIKANNGEISYIDFLDANQKDAIVVEPDGSFKIFLSSHTGVLRDNFTIAHEIGHRVLHWPRVRKQHQGSGMRATRQVVEDQPDSKRCEMEANWFAAAFLMPRDQFQEAYSQGIDFASEKFGVTRSAIIIREKSLNDRGEFSN